MNETRDPRLDALFNQAREELQKAVADRKVDAIKSGIERLSQASHKLSAHLYEQAQGAAGPEAGAAQAEPEPGAGTPQGEDVVDAEFEVKDDENK